MRLRDDDYSFSRVHPGEVIELGGGHLIGALIELSRLEQELRADHLQAVPVGRLLHDSGVPV